MSPESRLSSIVGVEIQENVKFLGIHLDGNLSWDTHINYVATKLNKAYFGIRQLKNIVDIKSLLLVYHALAISHINYSIMLWGSSTEIKRIFILQKRLIRLIFSLGYQETCRDTFEREKILTIPALYVFKCVMFVKKCPALFPRLSQNRITRNANKLLVPKHKTQLFEKSPLYCCVQFYNKLPRDIINLKPLSKFKSAVHELLSSKALYKVNDFLE